MSKLTPEFLQNIPWSLWWIMPPFVKRLGGFLYSCLNSIGFTWPFIYMIGPLFYSNIGFSDPLDWRAFSLNSEHHIINLWLIGGCFVLMAIFMSRRSESSAPPFERLRSIYSFGAVAAFAAWTMLAMHEGEWWITIVIFDSVHGFSLNWQWFAQLGELAALATFVLLPIMTGYFPWRFALVMGGFYLVWFAAGFPITVNYTGNTVGFLNDYVNSWEVGSWLFAVVAFYLTERGRFYDMILRVKQSLTKGQNYLSKVDSP